MSVGVVVGTWTFSKEATERAVQSLQDEQNTCITAVEQGLNYAENNADFGVYYVGRCGIRNREGYLELDAALMDGKTLNFGAVTALKGIARASSVARTVMEVSPHNMLTSDGALLFAQQQGFPVESELFERKESSDQALKQKPQPSSHDTLGMLALDPAGNCCAGVTTSGMARKFPGRVGDSALPGCGLYADSTAGAACCTGDGDEIMKYCPSFHIVQLMKQGRSPQEACREVLGSIHNRRSSDFEMSVLALNMKGEIGAATSVKEWTDPGTLKKYPGFPYSFWTSGMKESKISIQPCSVV